MLKKSLLLCILLGVSSSVFALPFSQCPPITALKHPVKGQNWVLDPEYIKQGWQVDPRNIQGTNDSDATELTPSSTLRVGVVILSANLSGAGGKETVACSYELTSQTWIRIDSNQWVNEESIPQPPFSSNDAPLKAYFCEMPMTASFAYCAWPMK